MCIRDRDNYTPYDRGLTSKLIQLAKTNNIHYCVDVFYHYGTDASAAIRALSLIHISF